MSYPTTAAMNTVKCPVPAKVYAQDDLLYVHTGADYRVVARVGNLGKVAVSESYPRGAFAENNMAWANDREGVATYMAVAVNAHPVLRRQVTKLEARNAELMAKLALATEAIKRGGSLDATYAATLVRDFGQCLERNRA